MESVRDRDNPTSITSEYDVFLSFRGPDARYGFVDHLYECMTGAGLRVFKDDEEIRRGEVIGGELEQAIRGSRVYAVIFSRNYASSTWCLRELDMMVDLCGGSNVGRKIILPIFYGVDPADVKLRTELYRKALDAQKDRHGQDVVKIWEEALKKVGGISGWDSQAIQGEGRFVRLIVQDIVVKLRIKDQSLPDHLTGIDDRVLDMLNLLDCDSSGVRLVVINGMGGIGKTTIARVIFNKLSSQFEGSSFISNMRESATGHGGIEKLQNKLLEDILGGQNARSSKYDDEIIRRIQCKRVLLVLDDVDELSQLKKLVGNNPKDTLGAGSRVIVTARDKSVCNRFVRPGSELLYFYEMEKMDDNHALQLFSRHAFGTNEPPQDYLCLSKQVVKTTGNLPLALEVIGGHLCCQSKELWEDMLEKLKNVPQEEVFETLKVSYEGLGFREKEIFLDIACFRQEMPRRYADFLWEARKLYPKVGVKILINKSLIKIDSFGEFWIHDQLRDMGREIIRSEGLGRPERCTRLWDPKDALEIVHQKVFSGEIIAMYLGRYGDEGREFSYENFRGLSQLLYLHLNWTRLTGDFGNLQEKLMWLSWNNCSKQFNSEFFMMRNLVVLIINGGGWQNVEKLIMPNLRVLAVWQNDMTMTPDVSCCSKLEIMNLQCLDNLEEIHRSVGKLESLSYIKIFTCRSLRSLPRELCCARALRKLIVTLCNIKEVPESIGMLVSLTTLNLYYNEIRRLPASICDLTKLRVLNVANNPLDEGIPEEIGRLSALEELDLSGSNIRFLPATVSQLTSLKSLKLRGCNMLQELQGLPTRLTYFEFSWMTMELSEEIRYTEGYGVRTITFSGAFELGFLSRLKTFGWRFPDVVSLHACVRIIDFRLTKIELGGLDSLPSLTELSIRRSDNLLGVSNIWRLRGLRSLEFSWCRALVEIPGLEQLELLEELRILGCHSIRGIQDLLGLKRLKVVTFYDCSSLLHVPRAIDECRLIIEDCDKLEDFEGSYREYGRKDISFDA